MSDQFVAERTYHFFFTQSGWLFLFCQTHFFRAALNWGKPAKLSLPQNFLNWADVIPVRSPFSSSIIPPRGKPFNLWTLGVNSLRPKVPSWIKIRENQSASHRNTLSPLQLWLCQLRRKYRSDSHPFHPLATFSGDIHTSLPKRPGPRPWATTTFLSSTSKYDFYYTMANIYSSHIQQCLNQAMHLSLWHFAAKMPSQLYNNFISFRCSLLPTRLAAYLRKPLYSMLPLRLSL